MAKATSKYAGFILREPLQIAEYQEAKLPVFKFNGDVDFGGAGMVMACEYITEPRMGEKAPHTHDFDQLLVFLGGNPMDMRDFGAEVELSLGAEGEKQVITGTSVVFVPKGMLHCPLNFKKVDKPILFVEIGLMGKYTEK